MLGELVGLALRAEGKTSLTIDLVPDQVFRERETTRRKPWLGFCLRVTDCGLGCLVVDEHGAQRLIGSWAQENHSRG